MDRWTEIQRLREMKTERRGREQKTQHMASESKGEGTYGVRHARECERLK